MALTQVFPSFEASLRKFGESAAVPLVGRPEEVEFRSGGNLTHLIGLVTDSRYVKVNAAPGAGKTVRFPAELAKMTKGLVVHVLPFEALAMSVYRHVKAAESGLNIELITRVEQEWPQEGWVLVSAACVVAKWMREGEPRMPVCYLLHDESHESGAASAVLRALGPVVTGVLSYVSMTATSAPIGARPMETGGRVDDQLYEREAFQDPWSVEESGAPWAVDSLEGHILLFEDDDKRAKDLVQAYNYNGCKAFRLSARTTAEEMNDVLNHLYVRSVRVCVLVADSTFRSGHTFPVSIVIDSGLVRRVVVNEEGLPVYRVREIYEFERVQSRARGGRMDRQHSTYWRPLGELQKRMCDLEQVDVEAFALICRCLGYRVPGFAAGAKMATGPIPRDVCSALNAELPLACIPDRQLVQGPAAEEFPVRRVEKEEVVRLPKFEAKIVPQVQTEAPLRHESGFEEAADMLRGLAQAGPGAPVDSAEYRCAEGVVTQDMTCMAFPDGAESVKRVLARDRSHTVHMGWSPYMRSVAVNALVHAHNIELLEAKAIVKVLSLVRAKPNAKIQSSLRNWAARLAERFGDVSTRIEAGAVRLDMVCDDFCIMVPCPGIFSQEEDQLAQAMLGEFGRIPDTQTGASAEEVKRVRIWVSEAETAHIRRDVPSIGDLGGGRHGYRVSPWLQYFSGYPRARIRANSSSSGSSGSLGPYK